MPPKYPPSLPPKTLNDNKNNSNKQISSEDIAQIEPVAFTINKLIHQNDIPAGLFLDCEIEIGGTRYPRIVAVNPHSIFILELNQKEVSKYFVRSQRALLEISRVSYTIGKAVKVVYKASQGGDHVTFYMKNPIDCVKAISGHLKRLGIQGNEAGASSRKKKQNSNNNNNINNNNNNDNGNNNKANTPQRRMSPFFGSSLLRGSSSRKSNTPYSNSTNSAPRFGGGGRNESPYASIKRLEKEMRARPTINVVRGIMDRYRRLIERCSADSRPRVQKQAEMLTRDLQLFLQRPEVLQTLSDQEQIEKQRHRRRDSLTLYDMDVENEARLASEGRRNGNASRNGQIVDEVTKKDTSPLGNTEENVIDSRTNDKNDNDYKEPPKNSSENKINNGIHDNFEGRMTKAIIKSSNTNNNGRSIASSPSDIDNNNEYIEPKPGWKGIPYHRKPGEVYKTPDSSKSQINHSRVAESGTLLPGRVLVEVTVKPPPITTTKRSLFHNVFTSPPINSNNKTKSQNQDKKKLSKNEIDQKEMVNNPSTSDNKNNNNNRRPSVELLASMMGESYEDVIKIVGNKNGNEEEEEEDGEDLLEQG